MVLSALDDGRDTQTCKDAAEAGSGGNGHNCDLTGFEPEPA